jgi:hypothetical protein
MDSRTQYNSYTVEDVFQDFKGRRAGLIKALTTGISNRPNILFFFFSNQNLNNCVHCKVMCYADHFKWFCAFFQFYLIGQPIFQVGLVSYT